MDFSNMEYSEILVVLARQAARRMYEAKTPEEIEAASKQLDRLGGHLIKERELGQQYLEFEAQKAKDEQEFLMKQEEVKNSWIKSAMEAIGTAVKGLSFGWLIGKVIDAEKDGFIRSTAFRLVSGLFRFKG